MSQVMMTQLWLEVCVGCSTIVTTTDARSLRSGSGSGSSGGGGEGEGEVPYIIRTMDWDIDEMRAVTFQALFVRQGLTALSATTL